MPEERRQPAGHTFEFEDGLLIDDPQLMTRLGADAHMRERRGELRPPCASVRRARTEASGTGITEVARGPVSNVNDRVVASTAQQHRRGADDFIVGMSDDNRRART